VGRERTWTRKYVYLCIAILTFLFLLGCATLEEIRIKMLGQKEARQYLLHSQELLVQGDYEGALRENQKVISLSSGKPLEAESLFNMGLIYAHPGNPKKDYGTSVGFFKNLMEFHPQSPLALQALIWVEMLQKNEALNERVEKLYDVIGKLNEVVEKSNQVNMKIEKRQEGREGLYHGQKLLAQGDYEGALRENQKVLSLSSGKPPEDEALFNMGLIYAHPGNPKKDYGKSLGFFKRLIKDYPKSPFVEQVKIWTEVVQENQKLNKTIEKLHQVIEESKQVDIEIEEKKREKK